FVDLGDLHLEELDEEPDVGAGENDLGPLGLAIDVLEERHDAIARAIVFARSLLSCGEHGLDVLALTDADDDILSALESADDPRDQFALAVLEFVVDAIALGVPHLLHDDLLRRLGGDASKALTGTLQLTEIAEILILLARRLIVLVEVEDLEAELLAGLGLEAIALRRLVADLGLLVIALRDDGHVLEKIDRAGLIIEARLELAIDTERALGRSENRLFGRLNEHFRINAFLLADLLDDCPKCETALLHERNLNGSVKAEE